MEGYNYGIGDSMQFGQFNLRLVLTAAAFAVVGGFAGFKLAGTKQYLRGQLDACNQITSTINKGLPIGLKCDTEGTMVIVTSALQPDVKYTLTGRTLGTKAPDALSDCISFPPLVMRLGAAAVPLSLPTYHCPPGLNLTTSSDIATFGLLL